MAIQPITRALFEQLQGRFASSGWMQEDIEWFADRSRIVIGYIARNVQSNDWTCVVEGRDERGQFYEIESQDGLGSRDDARSRLEGNIQELMMTGLKVFPRGAILLR
jgi:hypothetical protein